MMYLTPQTINIAHYPPWWGVITTPSRRSRHITPGRRWCADNGVFTGKFHPTTFQQFLQAMMPYQDSCLFVVAPDVVGQAVATLETYKQWGPSLQANGWLVAFVAQDGQEDLPFPATFDALFIGGSTAWKMSQAALACIKRAQSLGKWVHVGRVNSQKRIAHFQLAGVDSVDGTSICFAPKKNFRQLNKQLAKRPLFRL